MAKLLCKLLTAFLLSSVICPAANAYNIEESALYRMGDRFAVLDPDGILYEISYGALTKITDGVISFCAGTSHCAALKADGTLWLWGGNDHGQLGTGGKSDENLPVKILDNIRSVSLGNDFSAAVDANDHLFVWGGNEYGQLGTGDRENVYLPKMIAEGVSGAQAGEAHMLVQKTNEELWICGGEYGDVLRPVDIPGAILEMASLWAMPYIDKAKGYGLLPDKHRHNYRTDITREEFCDLIYAFLEAKTDLVRGADASQQSAFSDTESAHINIIAALGIINGTGKGLFSPFESITREQAARIIYITAAKSGYNTAAPPSGFSGISDWAQKGVDYVYANGIMVGDNGSFEPNSPITKEEVIVTLVRFYESVQG